MEGPPVTSTALWAFPSLRSVRVHATVQVLTVKLAPGTRRPVTSRDLGCLGAPTSSTLSGSPFMPLCFSGVFVHSVSLD